MLCYTTLYYGLSNRIASYYPTLPCSGVIAIQERSSIPDIIMMMMMITIIMVMFMSMEINGQTHRHTQTDTNTHTTHERCVADQTKR